MPGGGYIKSSFVTFSHEDRSYVPTEEIRYIPTTVIYLGMFFPVWGHVITDNIRRLWFLKSEVFNDYLKNFPLVYIPWNTPWHKEMEVSEGNFDKLLKILEVDSKSWKPINRPMQFEKIILPDESFSHSDEKFTKEYRETIDRIRHFALKNRTSTSIKKIYYFHGRNQFGEERLAEYFRSKGYTIVLPEKLTIEEQLNLMINAESFASTLGSCAHNSLFLRDGTEVIFIPRSSNRFTGHQAMIDQVHSFNLNYVDSSMSVFQNRVGPYCYIISEQLKKFFGDKFTGYSDDDFKTFLEYIRNALSRGLKLNPWEIAGYGATYTDFFAQLKAREDLLKDYGVIIS